MAEYAGSAIAGSWNNIQIPQLRRFEVAETADRGLLETTHGGDATKQYIDDTTDRDRVRVTVGGFMESGATAVVAGSSFNPGTTGSLDLYPEGAPAAGGNPLYYCHTMRVSGRTLSPAVGDVVPFELTFEELAAGSWISTGTSASYAA